MQLSHLLAGLAVVLPLAAQSGSGVELNDLDKSVSPCTNFYQYACGMWVKDHPVPPDQSRWSRFNELAAKNEEIEHNILDQAAQPAAGKTRTPVEQKIGDYYSACMNEAAIERKGIAPLKPVLDAIANLHTREQITRLVIEMHRQGLRPFFGFRVEPDEKNASIYIASVNQGGISMPDRDYYVKQDAKSQAIRDAYREHVRKMFAMLDEALGRKADAAAQAATVLEIETALADRSLERVAMRNPDNTYHMMSPAQLAELSPEFNWREYLAQPGMPEIKSWNVAEPDFFRCLAEILTATGIDKLKTYLEWRALNDTLNLVGRTGLETVVLPKRFADENWQFYSHVLNGVKEQQPRWKACVQMTDRLLGEALGQEFVQVAFSASSKAKTLEMVKEIEGEMAKVIQSAEWMSPATKEQAMTKLHQVANKIGYPEKWRDYGKVQIVPNDLFGDTQRAVQFGLDRQTARIGKAVDKSEWGMTPPTVNAYYSPEQNNINFPAGILQPPFYNSKAGDPVNYGGIGAVIGHELTHGFDDQGRRFDGRGNLRDWWTAEDGKAFDQRADCVVKEYGGFSPVPGVTLNGKLTLGENAADNGGLRLAFMALMDKMAGHPLTKTDGLTPQQQFFLGYAQLWCGGSTPESAAMRAKTDPHSPGEFRVNGVLQNMPEFSSAWGCKVGDAMVSDKACRIW